LKDSVPNPQPSLDDLGSPQPERRVKVLGYLALSGQISSSILARVAALLNDPHASVRHMAASVLAEVGPEARSCVPALVNTLKHPDDVLRRRVCLALGEIGPDARGAVASLIERLKTDTCPAVRRYAAAALGDIGVPLAISPLIETLASEEDRLRALAAASLKRLGRRAVPRLQEALNHAHPRVRAAAVRLLSCCDQRELVLDAVAALHQDADPEVRQAVYEALHPDET
jgi:HEAT repeat protein